jgi:hypothetical protein
MPRTVATTDFANLMESTQYCRGDGDPSDILSAVSLILVILAAVVVTISTLGIWASFNLTTLPSRCNQRVVEDRLLAPTC